jgi:hypothetical protein
MTLNVKIGYEIASPLIGGFGDLPLTSITGRGLDGPCLTHLDYCAVLYYLDVSA